MKVHLVCVLSLLVAGCSHSSDDGHDGHTSSSSSGSSGTSSSTSSSSTSSSSSGTTAQVKPPTVDDVMPMTSGLHVVWTNVEKACDAIEGERQAKAADGTVKEAYKVAFTVTGDIDNKHDAAATADLTYTYRLRCKKGDGYSEYSNEKSANPTKK